MASPRYHSVRSPQAVVASADQLATQAGLPRSALGGNAVDAAIATNAAIAVTAPHLCGMGGDLFALVHHDGEVLRAERVGPRRVGCRRGGAARRGPREMPFRHDIRSVTVPGCVDGWMALHERFGTLPLADVLAPAIALAERRLPGQPAARRLAGRASTSGAGENLAELVGQAIRARAPASAARARPRALRPSPTGGRDGVLRRRVRRRADGARRRAGTPTTTCADPLAEWVTPLHADAFGVDLWTIPPNSQGYLTLGAAELARRARPAGRPRRRPLGPPADRGGDRRRLRPARACCTTAPTATALAASIAAAARR